MDKSTALSKIIDAKLAAITEGLKNDLYTPEMVISECDEILKRTTLSREQIKTANGLRRDAVRAQKRSVYLN